MAEDAFGEHFDELAGELPQRDVALIEIPLKDNPEEVSSELLSVPNFIPSSGYCYRLQRVARRRGSVEHFATGECSSSALDQTGGICTFPRE